MGGDICWVNGPFPCGGYNDWTILNEYGLKDRIEAGERIEADDGYSGGDPEITKTRSSVFVSKEATAMRNRIRARHKALNGRLKAWRILCVPFRHGRGGAAKGLSSHQDVFFAIAVITQIRIENGEVELFSCEEYNDSFINYSEENKISHERNPQEM